MAVAVELDQFFPCEYSEFNLCNHILRPLCLVTALELPGNVTKTDFSPPPPFTPRNPLISSDQMCQRMEGRRMIRIPRLSSSLCGGDIEGDWVTIGVIVDKLPPRSANLTALTPFMQVSHENSVYPDSFKAS